MVQDDSQYEGGGDSNSFVQKRHKVAIDTVSLLEDDGNIPSTEDLFEGQQMFFEVIKALPTEREKFIALALFCDFSKQEIAFMLGVHPSRVTRNTQEMQEKLIIFLSSRARK